MKFITPSISILNLLTRYALANPNPQNNNNVDDNNTNNSADPDHIEVNNMAALQGFLLQHNKEWKDSADAMASASGDNDTDDDGNSKPKQPGARSGFIPGVDLLFQNLQDYGCWCFFNNKHGQGRGQPVDAFDTHCMKYHHAVSCAKLEIDNCNPYTTTYSITAKQSGQNGDITYDCETGNNKCQEATCYAQSHFISLLLKEQLENLKVPSYPLYSSWKDGGNFDSSTCKISGPGQLRQEMCCGSWKYNTKKLLRYGQHLSRSCCDQPDGGFKTYDQNLASCCSDGSVRVHGTC